MNQAELYYTPPSDEFFNELRDKAIHEAVDKFMAENPDEFFKKQKQKSESWCTCGPLTEEKKKEIDQHWHDNWEKVFDMFTKGDDSLGSAGWMVAPSTVKNFIKGLLESIKMRIIEQLHMNYGNWKNLSR